ncbi:peroxiredoxin [Sinomonas cellulolyticus]|uniref:OsmC family protein n=1 Tax=Sinomonas cellulolyticus TaxID=2801916 RepID=A0ABS1K2D1_9MICC|nr:MULTISPECIES: OsmC family protein [Sinomonas]MBL0705472.1 OsmC family protein [Sinomonas cellulolyticus]GHG41374.1 peroxiredoxin [Sinomonas sp. KCTC 49339]
MATIRNAHTVWNGTLMEGSGQTTLDSSGLGTYDVTWKARSEDANGKTSPEELIAAAHSACFSMAFSNGLAEAGYTATEITTKAAVDFVPGKGIQTSKLTVTAKVPGISEDEFQKIADGAKAGCPVSQALAGITITLDATLEA